MKIEIDPREVLDRWLDEHIPEAKTTRLQLIADLFSANGFDLKVRGWVAAPSEAPALPSGRLGLTGPEATQLIFTHGILLGICQCAGDHRDALQHHFYDRLDRQLTLMCAAKGIARCWGEDAKEPA